MIKFNVKVGKANTNSKSLRIALPLKVAEVLKIEQGDILEYNINSDGTVSIEKS